MDELLTNFPAFLLVLVRVTSFFVMMPLFSYRTIPNVYKIGLSFFLSWLIFYAIQPPSLEINSVYFFLIIKEALVGLLIGFTAFLIFSTIQIVGGFIDFQMGFSIANVIDPQTGAQSPLMGQYLYIFALLILLSINGHHLLIDGIYNSYHFIPINQPWLPLGNKNVVEYISMSFSSTFVVAFQMSIPIVGSLFLVDVALGIIGRTVPQFNIFVVGIPIKIIAGFVVMMIVMGVMISLVSNLIETTLDTMRDMMGLLGGSK